MIWLVVVALVAWLFWRELRGLARDDRACLVMLADLGDKQAIEELRASASRRRAVRAWFTRWR